MRFNIVSCGKKIDFNPSTADINLKLHYVLIVFYVFHVWVKLQSGRYVEVYSCNSFLIRIFPNFCYGLHIGFVDERNQVHVREVFHHSAFSERSALRMAEQITRMVECTCTNFVKDSGVDYTKS